MAKEEAQKKADDWLKSYKPAEEQTAYGNRHEEMNRESHTAGKR
jgi:hypothetical protein